MIAVVTFGVMRRRGRSPEAIARAARIRGCFLAGIGPTEAARRLGLGITTVVRHYKGLRDKGLVAGSSQRV
jgi:DNA-binding MarR family transcriptional regulator